MVERAREIFFLAPRSDLIGCFGRPIRWPNLRRAAALALLAFSAASVAGDLPKERQDALVHLLRHDCGSCHGMTLRGGLGPPLTPAALDGKAQAALEATILYGRAGTPMPPWQNMLSEAEVRWLVEALKSGSLK